MPNLLLAAIAPFISHSQPSPTEPLLYPTADIDPSASERDIVAHNIAAINNDSEEERSFPMNLSEQEVSAAFGTLRHICESHPELKQFRAEWLRATGFTVGGLTLGGLLAGGPVGFAVGAAVGAAVYAATSNKSTPSLIAILAALTPEEQRVVVERIAQEVPSLVGYLIAGETGKIVVDQVANLNWKDILPAKLTKVTSSA